MPDDVVRGSSKLMAAWKARALTEESYREIASAFEKSRGKVESAEIFGGDNPTGVRLTVSYDGDDVPTCGNDILFWLKWHLNHGGAPKPPRIIINGIPLPDLVRMQIDFGRVDGVAGLPGGPKDLGGGFTELG
jgi:hypothetical protein